MGKGLTFQFYKALNKDQEMCIKDAHLGTGEVSWGDVDQISFRFAFVSSL